MIKNTIKVRISQGHQVDSRDYKRKLDKGKVIDSKNIETCMNCPYPDCKKGSCKLIKR